MTLNDMVNNQGLRVFLNCTAGVSRGPTLMVVYLALFIKHKNWKDIDAVYQFVEDQYRW
jgi:protein-tyrosine phosphatase